MKKLSLLTVLVLTLFSACKKDETKTPEIVLPTSYNFENVNISGQVFRINMLSEIATELSKGKTQVLDFTKLMNMYSNTGNAFTDATLNTSGKQLRDKTFAADTAFFVSMFKAAADNSLSFATSTAGNGIAGVATSTTDLTKKYLVDSNGVEYAQILQKGLMGAVFYYRIAEEYTTKDKLNPADNNTIVAGEGTAMQHYWDEAFGYFGVPTTFTAAKYDSFNIAKALKFYGTYVSKGALVGTTENTLKAFIKGRDAINRKDYTTRDAAAVEVRKNFELINACSFISYMNQAKVAISDYAIKCHTLSEGYGFFISLKYNSEKKISQTDFNTIDANFKRNGKLSVAHLTVTEINTMIDKISQIYGLDAVKANL
ncbi:MAG TPA: DUF4856 domain-containing protein [Chitinophagales bacterium]|nr:DUF4856 domain-containing protein [Chitinophagales bacterium]